MLNKNQFNSISIQSYYHPPWKSDQEPKIGALMRIVNVEHNWKINLKIIRL